MSTVKSKKLQVGTDATATNNFTIYQPATPDGTLRVGVGNSDSPTEVGRFTSAGYKPATAPMFRAYQSAAQTITANTWTKITYNTETFDLTSNFDTTNYRFQPSVAGYYMIGGGFYITSAIRAIRIYKNGGGNSYINELNSSSGWGCYGYDILYLNGSTDYVELYGYIGTTANTSAASSITYFSAHLIQQA